MKEKRVAILHTSFVFINNQPVIKDQFRELLPDVKVLDFVDSQILADVQVEGITDDAVQRMTHMAKAAEAAGADVIFSACSSLGPTIDTVRKSVSIPIIKIDDEMTEQAVLKAERIGILATVPTTVPPTVALIEEKAAKSGKEIHILTSVAEGAFDKLMSGDKETHNRMVLDKAKELAPKVDLLVLAQASMTTLAPMLAEATELEVLTSPQLGVQSVKEYLEGLES
jgi:aspartate/glutamate racemase